MASQSQPLGQVGGAHACKALALGAHSLPRLLSNTGPADVIQHTQPLLPFTHSSSVKAETSHHLFSPCPSSPNSSRSSSVSGTKKGSTCGMQGCGRPKSGGAGQGKGLSAWVSGTKKGSTCATGGQQVAGHNTHGSLAWQGAHSCDRGVHGRQVAWHGSALANRKPASIGDGQGVHNGKSLPTGSRSQSMRQHGPSDPRAVRLTQPTCRRSQWLSMRLAVAAPLDRRRSSSAKPNDASAGR